MSIEINRNTKYTYRLNPFQPRMIDRRENKRGARWAHYSRHDTTFAAIEALMAAERDEAGEGQSNG